MTLTVIARKEGRAGRLTLNRPKALNALDHEMILAIEAALLSWRSDPEVALVLIDAVGERAFCAGGDVAAVYRAGLQGDFLSPAKFWRDEYRMNALIREYPKPIVAFLQGFVMGGGVGVGGHARLRIVGETTEVAMPETGIGLIPDVGGTLILSQAPGRIGEYLGLTGSRIGPADAIHAGFADMFQPLDTWEAIKSALIDSGDLAVVPAGASPPEGRLPALRGEIDALFSADTLAEVIARLTSAQSDFAADTLAVLLRNSALSEAATLRLVRMARATPDIRSALSNEFRFTFRAAAESDFMEGVRAQLIDKDRTPHWGWTHAGLPGEKVEALLAPLPEDWRIDFV